MSRQRWVTQALAVSLLAGGGSLAGTVSAFAEARVPISVTVHQRSEQAPLTVADAAAEARAYVTSLAKSYLPAEIRVSAWNVLRNSRGDEAIAEWLTPGGGYDYAKQRTREARSRNKAFCERVARTHTMAFSPEVHIAAERALKGTAADQAAFVKTGYAQAQQRDRETREADAEHQREVTASERDFVRARAEQDPGEQVQVAAQWALRVGSTDADIEEFFGYGWANGAALDLEAYRMRMADAETARHHTLSRLIKEAAAAEEAIRGAADAAKARADAERAWQSVAEHADAAQKAWLAEQAAATAQAEHWKNIAKASQETADKLWKNITEPAEANQETWAKEQAEAAETAKSWKDIFDRARDSENRVKG
ncbi:hypothetical protein [Streptomyces varsoviensis]|uniref:hypothetical protein n=1 Tax=Streptomyces varsoviensis TaxID=67373 RepID=UPI0004C7ABEA|nr:hypothetical protein [Streptomyces varsoviensis]